MHNGNVHGAEFISLIAESYNLHRPDFGAEYIIKYQVHVYNYSFIMLINTFISISYPSPQIIRQIILNIVLF